MATHQTSKQHRIMASLIYTGELRLQRHDLVASQTAYLLDISFNILHPPPDSSSCPLLRVMKIAPGVSASVELGRFLNQQWLPTRPRRSLPHCRPCQDNRLHSHEIDAHLHLAVFRPDELVDSNAAVSLRGSIVSSRISAERSGCPRGSVRGLR